MQKERFLVLNNYLKKLILKVLKFYLSPLGKHSKFKEEYVFSSVNQSIPTESRNAGQQLQLVSFVTGLTSHTLLLFEGLSLFEIN